MKKITRSVLHISQAFQTASKIHNQPETLFPFLNAPLLGAQAKKKISFHSIEAQCNLNNIQKYFNSLPICSRKQFVFFGRSNVGKSSLLNLLIQDKIAKTSKQPGKTKQLLFTKLNTNNNVYLVDCPGYGYASSASKTQINQWGKLVETYLKYAHAQLLILCLLDISHGYKYTDLLLFQLLKNYKKKFMIVFTKCDKMNLINQEKGIEIVKELQKKYQDMNFYVHFTSARQYYGIDQLRCYLMFQLVQGYFSGNSSS